MIETYGTKGVVSKIKDALKIRVGYIQLKERYSLEGLDKNEEEE